MNIFIADYLPLKNKGEEEILRGLEMLFSKKYNCSVYFSIFDDENELSIRNGVRVFPRSWVYPDLSKRRQSTKSGTTKYLYKSILYYFGVVSLDKKINTHKELYDALRKADLVLIGHDGFYNLLSAAMSFYLKKNNIPYSLLGAGFAKPNKKVRIISDLLNKRCFNNAKYVVLRERTAYNYVREISRNPNVYLYPDPAFYCPQEGISSPVTEEILNNMFSSSSIKIGLTVCENSISFVGAFLNSSDKVEKHREFFASLIRDLLENYDCEFVFLPHCIENGPGDDIAIAKDICKRVNSNKVHIIENDLPVLELKNIIAHLNYLIGERTHSIINCISSKVPFMSLTCSRDFRTHDIVEKGCGLTSCVINLDTPNFDEIIRKIHDGIKGRDNLKEKLVDVNKNLFNSFNELLMLI